MVLPSSCLGLRIWGLLQVHLALIQEYILSSEPLHYLPQELALKGKATGTDSVNTLERQTRSSHPHLCDSIFVAIPASPRRVPPTCHLRAEPVFWDDPSTITSFLSTYSSFPVFSCFSPFLLSLLERLKASVTLFPHLSLNSICTKSFALVWSSGNSLVSLGMCAMSVCNECAGLFGHAAPAPACPPPLSGGDWGPSVCQRPHPPLA